MDIVVPDLTYYFQLFIKCFDVVLCLSYPIAFSGEGLGAIDCQGQTEMGVVLLIITDGTEPCSRHLVVESGVGANVIGHRIEDAHTKQEDA